MARGIQGAFVGHSRGIRVQKREFRNMTAREPMKTCGFLRHWKDQGDTELPLYNIKKEKQPQKMKTPTPNADARPRGLEFYRGRVYRGRAALDSENRGFAAARPPLP